MAYRLWFRFVSVDFVRLCPINGYRNYTQLHSDSTIRSKILKFGMLISEQMSSE